MPKCGNPLPERQNESENLGIGHDSPLVEKYLFRVDKWYKGCGLGLLAFPYMS